MRLKFIILVILCSLKSIQAQKTDEDLRLYFSDAEFFLAEEEYVDALYDYLELYNNGFENNANINYRIGICYLNIPGQKDRAIPHLEKAITNTKLDNRESIFREKKAPLDAYLYLGNAYRVNNDLEKAIESYKKYKELLPSSDKANIGYIDKQIDACNVALKYMENPIEIKKSNLGDLINNSASNYKAVISGDGNTLMYMNELPFYDAVYFSSFENGQWSEPVNITSQIQSDGDQFVSSITYDGSQLFLTKEDNFNSDIYTSSYLNEQWTKSVPLDKPVNSKYWESHASISRDGKTLYFTSNRRGGFGEMDIYKSVLNEEGKWDKPQNLGSVINTALNEDTPFITEDGKSLFFSSQGHTSMGGYDIYVSSIDEEGNFAEPVNLGYPINTTDDDLFFYPWNDGKVGYLALLEPAGYGKEDIYKIITGAEEITEEVITEEIEEGEEKDLVLEKVPVEEEKIEEVYDEIEEEEAEEEPVEIKIVEFELSPVYFKFDSYALTEKGKIKLDEIASLLKDYAEIKAELQGHTDAKGPNDYNQRLSEKRASSALNYLVGKSINTDRLKATGFGETRFIAINNNPDGSDNPEGRKYNRRVEFVFTGINKEQIRIKRTEIPENLKIK
jgi:outer membrane protein OmpA-like peptidoglycan-associated protein